MSSLSFDECERNTSRPLPAVEISRAKHSSVRKIFAQEIKAVPVAAQRANKDPIAAWATERAISSVSVVSSAGPG